MVFATSENIKCFLSGDPGHLRASSPGTAGFWVPGKNVGPQDSGEGPGTSRDQQEIEFSNADAGWVFPLSSRLTWSAIV